jgi:hypothetical protein
MPVKYFIKENKNPLNVFGSSRTSTGEESSIKEDLHDSSVIRIIKVLFRFYNNRREMFCRSQFERI